MMKYKYDMSRQEQIDRMMCKPGYTWNETLQKCLGYGGGAIKENPTNQPPPQKPLPDEAIAQEIASRESTGEVA